MKLCNSRPALSRRDYLRLCSAGVVGFSVSGWLEALAAETATDPRRRRACILLWMNGGPSQMDTFDLKPGHANGGPFKEIQTDVPGLRFSEHLPKLAKQAKRLALIRSMKTKEADHSRATYLMRTGYAPAGAIQFPTLGSMMAKELERADAEMPGFVSVAPFRVLSPGAYESGFLGPQYAPLVVGENANSFFGGNRTIDPDRALKLQDLNPPRDVPSARVSARIGLLDEMEKDFLEGRSDLPGLSHRTAYQRAVTMMRSTAVKAFDLDDEPRKLRDGYGRNIFGQGCLLARRLVERGVPFVEVTLSGVDGGQAIGWDTHQDNFENIKKLSPVLDAGWSTLMDDLQARGLLDSTLIVWMGEFGRTPKINTEKGRDHWANSWSTVLAGGGIKGGQIIGKTSADGTTVEARTVTTPDLLATVITALGLDVRKQNLSNVGRPIRLADPTAKAITEVLS